MNLIVTGCDVLPTVTLVSPQTWAANTFTWTMRKQAQPSQVSVPFGQAALVNYQLFFTKTQTAGNYWLSGTINIVNTQTGTVGIRSVLLQSTTGASQTPSCFAGTSGGFVSDGSFGTTGTSANILLGPGQTNTCQFNLSLATGSAPPSGTVTVQVTTTGGQTATSSAVPVDFTAPTQAWNINDCVAISDSATVQAGSTNWTPQVTGLPQNVNWCTATAYTYTATLGAPPRTVQCNTPLTVSEPTSCCHVMHAYTCVLEQNLPFKLPIVGHLVASSMQLYVPAAPFMEAAMLLDSTTYIFNTDSMAVVKARTHASLGQPGSKRH